MRIVVISEGVPSRIGGGRSRQINLLKALAGRHEYSVITFGDQEERQAIEELQHVCHEVIVLDRPLIVPQNRSRVYYRVTGWKHTLVEWWPNRGRWLITNQAKQVVKDTLQRRQFDLVQVHQGYLAPLLPKHFHHATLLDMHDVLSDYERHNYALAVGPGMRLGAYSEWRKMIAFEQRTIERFDACTVVSEADRCSVKRLVPHANPVVVPNGVDTTYFRPTGDEPTEPIVVFVGSLNYAPNESGILHFFKHIWPGIRASVPAAKLMVVGTSPSEQVRAMNGQCGVSVVGEVPDVRPYFSQAAVSISPIYTASGTRLKILDAWAMGKAVVSTTLGAHGLEARDRDNILLADSESAFADAVVELIRNRDLRRALGIAGRTAVMETYDWLQIAEQLQVAYDRATEEASRRRYQ